MDFICHCEEVLATDEAILLFGSANSGIATSLRLLAMTVYLSFIKLFKLIFLKSQ